MCRYSWDKINYKVISHIKKQTTYYIKVSLKPQQHEILCVLQHFHSSSGDLLSVFQKKSAGIFLHTSKVQSYTLVAFSPAWLTALCPTFLACSATHTELKSLFSCYVMLTGQKKSQTNRQAYRRMNEHRQMRQNTKEQTCRWIEKREIWRNIFIYNYLYIYLYFCHLLVTGTLIKA